MKKFFLGLATLALLAGCANDATIATAPGGAIDFAAASDKATRSVDDPSITTQNITDLAVYGFMNSVNGVVFDDELVSNRGGLWSYQNTQYWTRNTYYFAALAPSNDRNWKLTKVTDSVAAKYGIGSVNFVNDGKQDLLYWAGVYDNTTGACEDAKVAIDFKHLLSKVKFTFANQFDNPNVSIIVKDIKINKAASEANINLAVDKWWENGNAWVYVQNATADYAFGNAVESTATADTDEHQIGQYQKLESYHEMLLFPQENVEYNITFTVELYMGAGPNALIAGTYQHDIDLTTTFEMGKAYNLKATINAQNIIDPDYPGVDPDKPTELKPIEFTVEVTPWEQAGADVAVNYDVYNNGTISNDSLSRDGVVNGSLAIAGDFDGKGFTLFAEATPRSNQLVKPQAGSTIQNVTIDGLNGVTADGKGIRNIYIDGVAGATYNFDKVISRNCTYAFNTGDNAAAEINITNSVLEGWSSWGSKYTVNLENVSFENGNTQQTVRPHGNTTFTNCQFEEGFVILLDKLENRTVTFENCKYAGQPLTSAKLTDVSANATVIIK